MSPEDTATLTDEEIRTSSTTPKAMHAAWAATMNADADGQDADGQDADGTDTDGSDGDAVDTTDGDASDADSQDA